jgi:hypothetical protein
MGEDEDGIVDDVEEGRCERCLELDKRRCHGAVRHSYSCCRTGSFMYASCTTNQLRELLGKRQSGERFCRAGAQGVNLHPRAPKDWQDSAKAFWSMTWRVEELGGEVLGLAQPGKPARAANPITRGGESNTDLDILAL